jgi:hypothetical protein
MLAANAVPVGRFGLTVAAGDPTMWGAGVTAWDGACHTRRVQHLCVIIIDERVG